MKKSIDPLVPIYQVDAFASAPFKGNPAGVCFLMSPQPDAWMQNLAREMNLSETAFFTQKKDVYHLRWFTPQTEVDLCGHATLATAHIIWETGLRTPQEGLRFETRSGILEARKQDSWIVLDFPAEPASTCPPPEGLAEALGAPIVFCGQNRMDYLIELASEKAVRALKPDFRALEKISSRGFIVTAVADEKQKKYDFVSRFFGPGVGIDEDPVTGSAHCCLAPFWLPRLGKAQLKGYQASDRGGIVKVSAVGERIALQGQAITMMQGVITSEGLSA